jgi:hypothetical protein
MSTDSEPDSGLAAREVVLGAGLTGLFPQLLRGARTYLRGLGWAEGSTYRPAVLEQCELVNASILVWLEPDKRWPAQVASDADGVVRVLSKTMFRLAMDARKKQDRWVFGDVIDQQQADDPSPSQRSAGAERIERIRRGFAGDREALVVLDEFAEGRFAEAQLARALGSSLDHVKVVKQRMERRFESGCIALDDEGEAGPSSPGPQRRYDGPQETAAHRRGAAGQPDHGACHTRRGRPDR